MRPDEPRSAASGPRTEVSGFEAGVRAPGAPVVPQGRHQVVLFTVFYALLLTTVLTATRNTQSPALIWPTDAIAVGTYLLFVGSRLSWCVVAVTLTSFLVHQLLGETFAVTLACAFATGCTFGIMAWWCTLADLRSGDVLDIPKLAGLVLVTLLATLPGALVGGPIMALTQGGEIWARTGYWWGSGVAAMLLLLPPFLIWHDGPGSRPSPTHAKPPRRRFYELELALATLALAMTIGLAARTGEPLLLDISSCVLLWLAFRFGLFPTALAIALLTLGVIAMGFLNAWPGVSQSAPFALLKLQARLVLTAGPALLIAVITAQQQRQQSAIEEDQRRLAYALEGANDGIWDWHMPSDAIFFSARAYRMLGYTPVTDAATLARFRELIHPDDLPIITQAFQDHAEGRHGLYQCEVRGRHRNGAYVWLLARGKIVERDSQNQPVRMVGTITDVSQKKHLEAALEHAASHDPLTGLANRSTFDRTLEHARRRLARDGLPFAVLLVDLDHFKRINDVHGHIAGDLLLTTIARRLQSALRAGDVAARFGGDEFAVVANGKTAEEFAALADRLHAHLTKPVETEGLVLPASISIGMAVATQPTVDLIALVAEADAALYMAKDAGRGTWRALGMLGEGRSGSHKVA